MNILCLGDSNTYGWDPRDALGNPYDTPWPAALEQLTRIRCINLGMPGLCLPASERERQLLLARFRAHPDAGLLLLMLGTNDILQGREGQCVPLMEQLLLANLRQNRLPVGILALPEIRIPGFSAQTVNAGYADLARRCGTVFLPPRDLPLAFDGIHLTEPGHLLLARAVAELLPGKWKLQTPGKEGRMETGDGSLSP